MKKKILFVCVENSCRSQMAEGFAKYYGKDAVEAYSAGSSPSGKVNQSAIVVMRELGIDILSNASKGFRDLPVIEFDYLVGMGCKDACPFSPVAAAKRVEWEITDPKGQPIEFFRKTRDEIFSKVKGLVDEIKSEGKNEKTF